MPDLTKDDLPKLDAAPEMPAKDAPETAPKKAAKKKAAAAAAEASTTDTLEDGTHVMLFGCDPHELSPEVVGDEFSTLRATDKWANALKVGDRVDAYQSIKTYDHPTEGTYPDTGEFIAHFEVTGIETHIGLSAALQASARTNHFCKQGRSIAALEELIRRIYPESMVRSGKGWSIIHLKRL